MSGLKGGHKDPSKGINNDNSSSTHLPENQGMASNPRTAEDLRALIQTLAIGPNRDAISINTNLPPFTLSTTTNGLHAANNEDSLNSKRPHSFGTPFTPQKPANSKGQSQLPSSDAAKEENAQMPLPIGTEKKLGLIERIQPQPQYGYPSTPKSPSSFWPQYHGGWVETQEIVSPMSPSSRVDYRPDHPYYGQYQDGIQGHEEQWNRYQLQRDRKEDLNNNHNCHSSQSGNLPRRTITFNPFADDMYNTTSMNINSSSAKSGSSQPRNGQPISGIEDHNFSDLVSTPGFGGFGVTFGASSYFPAYNGNHQQYQDPASTASNTRPNAAQLTQALSNAGKRSSAYGNEWYAQNNQGQAHQDLHRQRRPSMSHSTRYPPFEAGLVRAHTGTSAQTVPTDQFATPGPERRPNADNSALVLRKTPWAVTQYTNTGLLPPNWGPGTGFDSGPPPPTPFAPGDWLLLSDPLATGDAIADTSIGEDELFARAATLIILLIEIDPLSLCLIARPAISTHTNRPIAIRAQEPSMTSVLLTTEALVAPKNVRHGRSSTGHHNNSKASNELNRSNDQIVTIFSGEVSLPSFSGNCETSA
ncbi:hypothetical protein L486_02080 [Kwoniella mangroviensis CBS 10435]|uniref:Uncharacterized protein n=1 Tax=Kwoniella mangroviensis CBS 10435 TaxID=1331196 RepID=A0A1B9IV74_9TREE|nr:hypothetical protein L486_02080 [Kwoniella mangroviensis CBS 10435]